MDHEYVPALALTDATTVPEALPLYVMMAVEGGLLAPKFIVHVNTHALPPALHGALVGLAGVITPAGGGAPAATT